MPVERSQVMSDQTAFELKGPDFEQVPLSGSVEEKALVLFKSVLCNTPEERTVLSNAIHFWDLIPKYSAEHLHQKNKLPNVHERKFDFHGRCLRMTLFPGTIYRREGRTEEEQTTRRYPGAKEQAVEQALVKLASEQAEMQEVQGQMLYRVAFSINHLRQVLKSLGSTYSHIQVKESLEILSTSLMTVSDESEKRIQRSPILPTFECISESGKATNNPNSQWLVTLHPLVAHSIRHATYRQYNMTRFAGHRSYGVYLLRQMILNATNISPAHPYTVSYTSLQNLTSGLNYARAADGVRYLEKEIKRMKESGCILSYEREDVFVSRRNAGRKALADARFTLYPSESLIAEVKASSKRQSLVEQSLQLKRSMRSERQMGLPLK